LHQIVFILIDAKIISNTYKKEQKMSVAEISSILSLIGKSESVNTATYKKNDNIIQSIFDSLSDKSALEKNDLTANKISGQIGLKEILALILISLFSKQKQADSISAAKDYLPDQAINNIEDKEKQADYLYDVITEKIKSDERLKSHGKARLNGMLYNLFLPNCSWIGSSETLTVKENTSTEQKIAVYKNVLNNFEELVTIAEKEQNLFIEEGGRINGNQKTLQDYRESMMKLIFKNNPELLEIEKNNYN